MNWPQRKPRLLDLFCGAGGATRGFQMAGFHVTGIDLAPMPNYCGDEFHCADAMTFPLDGYDVIFASPPCQDHSVLSSRSPEHGTGWMLRATIERLEESGKPFVVENVPGSGPSMGGQWITLCGSSFGLKVRRHRLFRSNVPLMSLPCNHTEQGQPVGCYGGGTGGTRGRKGNAAERAEAMQITWMTVAEMSQAVPPAYTKFIGEQLLNAISPALVPQESKPEHPTKEI